MKRTVKEWIEFLNMGSNHYIGLEMKNGMRCQLKNYLPAPNCIDSYDSWLDCIVTKAYIINTQEDNKFYHLLIYSVE